MTSGKETYKFALCSSVLRKASDMSGLIQNGTEKQTPPVLGRIDYADISGGSK